MCKTVGSLKDKRKINEFLVVENQTCFFFDNFQRTPEGPDKAHSTGTMMGGTYHLFYGCTGKFSTIINKFVCCDQCYNKMLLKEIIGSDGTTTCRNWYSLDISLMEHEPDDNFPTDQLFPQWLKTQVPKNYIYIPNCCLLRWFYWCIYREMDVCHGIIIF